MIRSAFSFLFGSETVSAPVVEELSADSNIDNPLQPIIESSHIWSKHTLQSIENRAQQQKWHSVQQSLQQLYTSLSDKVPSSKHGTVTYKKETTPKPTAINAVNDTESDEKIAIDSTVDTIADAISDSDSSGDPFRDSLHEQLSCGLCLCLMVEPITLPCGHTYCRVCIIHALQKCSKKCPHCRAVCHITANHSENISISAMVKSFFPKEYVTRLGEIESEKKRLSTTVPCFVMNKYLFPTAILGLHLFEPRYKLMINRVISSGRKFAYLCKSPNAPSYAPQSSDIAVLLNVEECEFLHDGRCLLRTKVESRIVIQNCWIEQGTQGLWYVRYTKYTDESKADNGLMAMDCVKTLNDFVNGCYARVGSSFTLRDLERIQLNSDHSNAEKYSFFVCSLMMETGKLSESQHSMQLEMLSRMQSTIDRFKLLQIILIGGSQMNDFMSQQSSNEEISLNS